MRGLIELLDVRGVITVQDGGRPGQMRHGVPIGGALVPELLASANAAVGNVWSAAAMECAGAVRLRAEGGALRLSVDGEAHSLHAGETFEVAAPSAPPVRYVAVAGGLDVPLALGGRGTLAVARLGGLEGRALRRGDRIAIGGAAAARVPPAHGAWRPDPETPLRVLPGPDRGLLGEDAWQALLREAFAVSSTSDRVGTRLSGAAIPHAHTAAGASAPMVRGAIQITPSGEAIVLGPDHPTTGGYPVLAVLIRADWGAFAARPAGSGVRFRTVSLEDARAAAARWPISW